MKKNVIIYLILMVSVVLGLWSVTSSSAQAQREDLDTLLARAAAKGFLVTLTRPELSDTMHFYLLENIDDDLLAELQAPAVESFEIIGTDWISDVTYQVKVILQPGDREIAVYTGKYNGRWRVEGIDLPTGSVPGSEPAGAGEATVAPVSSGVTPVLNNGSGQLVFQTESGGDIYLINADGTGLRRITHGIDPQLSPDGRQIAFTRWEPRYELFTINVDGSGERAWTQGWRQMKSPTWSADGSKLIFSWQNGGRLEPEQVRISLAEAAQDDDPVRVPRHAVGVEIEDGILKYTIPADTYWFLKQVDLATGQFSDLLTERHSYGPTGHPSQANQVIYKSNTGIALNNTETGVDQAVSTDHRDHTPVISPDGQRVAVSYWQDGHWEVHTMNIDGSNRQRLTSTPITVIADKAKLESKEVMGQQRLVVGENPWWNNAAPIWSPDGSKIAFVTDRRDKWEIWIMNADGSEQRPMFANGALDDLTLNYAGVDERMLSWR